RVIKSAQTHHGPGGLTGGAWPLAFEDGVVVGVAPFAPAAVGVLNTFQPGAGLEQPGLLHVEIQGPQAAQDLPGAIDVVDPPTAIPGAILFLMFANKVQGFYHLRVVYTEIFVA